MQICIYLHYLFCNFTTDLGAGDPLVRVTANRKSPIVDTMGLLGSLF